MLLPTYDASSRSFKAWKVQPQKKHVDLELKCLNALGKLLNPLIHYYPMTHENFDPIGKYCLEHARFNSSSELRFLAECVHDILLHPTVVFFTSKTKNWILQSRNSCWKPLIFHWDDQIGFCLVTCELLDRRPLPAPDKRRWSLSCLEAWF